MQSSLGSAKHLQNGVFAADFTCAAQDVQHATYSTQLPLRVADCIFN